MTTSRERRAHQPEQIGFGGELGDELGIDMKYRLVG